MNVYNNLTLVHDAINNRDIEVLAPTYDDACKYEEFLTKTFRKITKYRIDNDIIINFQGKKQYYDVPKQ